MDRQWFVARYRDLKSAIILAQKSGDKAAEDRVSFYKILLVILSFLESLFDIVENSAD